MLTRSLKRLAFLVVPCVMAVVARVFVSQNIAMPQKAFGGNPTPKLRFGTVGPTDSPDSRLKFEVVTAWSTDVPDDERMCDNVVEPMTLEKPSPKLNYPIAKPAGLSAEFALTEIHLEYGVCKPDVNHTDTITDVTPSVVTTYSTSEGVSISLQQIKPDYLGDSMQVKGSFYKDEQINGVRYVVTNMGIDVVQPFIRWTDGKYQYMLWGGGMALSVDDMIKIAASIKTG